MRILIAEVIWAIDDTIFKLHSFLFPKHFDKTIEENPEKVSFLTELGFTIWLWRR